LCHSRDAAVVAAALEAVVGVVGVDICGAGPAASVQARLPHFLQGLRGRGFVEGRTMTVLVRAADYDPAQVARAAAEFVARPVSVAVAVARSTVRELRARSASLPIVALDLESDPIQDGFVASLARPGGNVTGLFFDFPEFGAKLVECSQVHAGDVLGAVACKLKTPACGIFRPLQGCSFQIPLDYGIDEAHSMRLLGTYRFACKNHLQGRFRTNQPGQTLRAACPGNQAALDLRQG
jgi:hypothetical protein